MWRSGRYNDTPKFYVNVEGKKVCWKLWRSLYLQTIPFTLPSPKKFAALQSGERKGFCESNEASLLTTGVFTLRTFYLLPFKTLGCSLCSFTVCPATYWDRDQYCSWHHHFLQGFLSANLWEFDYVLEVFLWSLLIEALGALTVCLLCGRWEVFSHFLSSRLVSAIPFVLAVKEEAQGPVAPVTNLGLWSQHKNLKMQILSIFSFIWC